MGESRAAAARRLDDDMHVAVFEGWQVEEVGHELSSPECHY
jgi:hypothetical protein